MDELNPYDFDVKDEVAWRFFLPCRIFYKTFIAVTGYQILSWFQAAVVYFIRALVKNSTLQELNIGSNELSEPTANILAQVIASNSVIKKIDISCNRIGVVSAGSLRCVKFEPIAVLSGLICQWRQSCWVEKWWVVHSLIVDIDP